ncbi:MAG: helix-turn-helix domain-containing protein [Clostridia bacterium]|nr:helix-turn-helix domain-containing protein [Clostridia bacterium]
MVNRTLLKTACNQNGRNFSSLASVLGVWPSTIYYKIEHNTFTADEAEKILEFLGCEDLKDIIFPDIGETGICLLGGKV